MQALTPIETITNLQLTDEDKIRIGIAWDALSANSRRAYQLAWRQLDDFLSAKGETLDNFTDTQLAAYLSTLDAKGIAPSTLSVNLAAIKWYFSNVRGQDIQFPISQKRLKTIRRDAKGRGRGQVDALVWTDVERVCAFAESDGSIIGYRDSAMIRLMSDCLLRVSEVVAVNCGHFKQNTLIVQRSKTDQQGDGVALYVTSDTRNAISKYREKAGITRGALYSDLSDGVDIYKPVGFQMCRQGRSLRERAADAGIEGFISGHSLRVGSAVSLAKAGASVVDLQVAGRWKNSQMPAHYARAEMAERGAIARYKEKETDRSQF